MAMAKTLVILLGSLALCAPTAEAAIDPPELGKTVNVRPVKGQVFVGGEHLTDPRQIPVGTVIDTRNGAVRLTSARDDSGATQSGRFSQGRFRARQADDGLTVLRLTGSREAFETCSGDRTIRRLRASVHGNFRTRGRYSSATADGTLWVTKDTCSSTTTVVARGQVDVDDFGRNKTVTVSAGERYTAGASSKR
jgi:hypothetical protein